MRSNEYVDEAIAVLARVLDQNGFTLKRVEVVRKESLNRTVSVAIDSQRQQDVEICAPHQTEADRRALQMQAYNGQVGG